VQGNYRPRSLKHSHKTERNALYHPIFIVNRIMNSMKSMSFFLFLMKKGFSGVCLYFTFQHKATITKATFIFLRTESISFRHRIFIVNISKNKMKVIFFFFSRKKSFFFFFLVFVLVCSRSFAVALHNYFAFCSLYIESATLISPLLR